MRNLKAPKRKNKNKEKNYILEIPEVTTRIKEEIISLRRRYFKKFAELFLLTAQKNYIRFDHTEVKIEKHLLN